MHGRGPGARRRLPASLATYRDAIAELTERIEALAAKRAVLVTQLREAAHRTAPHRTAPVQSQHLTTGRS